MLRIRLCRGSMNDLGVAVQRTRSGCDTPLKLFLGKGTPLVENHTNIYQALRRRQSAQEVFPPEASDCLSFRVGDSV